MICSSIDGKVFLKLYESDWILQRSACETQVQRQGLEVFLQHGLIQNHFLTVSVAQIIGHGLGQLLLLDLSVVHSKQIFIFWKFLNDLVDIAGEIGHMDRGQEIVALLEIIRAFELVGVGLSEKFVEKGLALAINHSRTDHIGLYSWILIIENHVLDGSGIINVTLMLRSSSGLCAIRRLSRSKVRPDCFFRVCESRFCNWK